MPKALIQLVAVVLLAMQVMVAALPGRMLCVPVAECGGNEGAGVCEHRDHVGSHDDEGDTSSGTQGVFALALHPDDGCACHVHVPVPGETPVPAKASARGENVDLRELAVPVPAVAFVVRDWDPARGLKVPGHDTALIRTDQVRSLRTTRLLI